MKKNSLAPTHLFVNEVILFYIHFFVGFLWSYTLLNMQEIRSKMQIPNNGTFQAWTFEAKCKYQTTEHSKLEHLKQNANTKQRNIPSLNIWSKMQIPNNGTFQAWTFEAKCKILNNDLYRSMVWTKGTYRVLRVVHSLEERAPPAFARNLLKSTMWWCKEMSNKRITLWRAQNLKSIKSVSEGAGLCLPQTILITAWSTKLHDQIAHAIHTEECPYNIKWKKVPEPHPQCLKAAPKKPRLYSKKQHSSTSVKGGGCIQIQKSSMFVNEEHHHQTQGNENFQKIRSSQAFKNLNCLQEAAVVYVAASVS